MIARWCNRLSRISQLTAQMATSVGRPKVYVACRVPSQAIDLLKDKCEVTVWDEITPVPRDVLLEKIVSQDALYCTSFVPVDNQLLEKGKNLKVIATMSVGYEHLDVAACRRRGIRLGYTPDVLTETCAELGVAMVLCTTRRLIEASQEVYSGKWTGWYPTYMCGHGIQNSTIGIAGLGRIGLSMAEKFKPFHPREIIYHNRKPSVEGDALGARYVSIDELLSKSDFVICCCPLTAETRGMFNKEKFSKMKSTAMFFNLSRGGLVVQDDLYDALQSGRIAGAGLDVCTPEPLPTNDKLLTLKNLVILPHIGSATMETRIRMATLTSENILAGLEGKSLPAEIP